MTTEEVFLDLLSRYNAAIRRIARVYAEPNGEQEDLYQEILMQIWRSLPNFRGDAAPGAWLYRVALNTALTWRRRERVRDYSSTRHVEKASAPVVPPASRSETAILEEFLGGLRSSERSLLLLYMEGLSYQEIADITGASPGSLGIRIHRIKKSFKERYLEEK